MDNRFKFEEEFDEDAIAIDYSDFLGKESILYSITKRLISLLSSMSLSNWRKPMNKWLFLLLNCSNRK